MATQLEQAALDYAAAQERLIKVRADLESARRLIVGRPYTVEGLQGPCLVIILNQPMLEAIIADKKERIEAAVDVLQLRSRALDDAAGIKPPSIGEG